MIRLKKREFKSQHRSEYFTRDKLEAMIINTSLGSKFRPVSIYSLLEAYLTGETLEFLFKVRIQVSIESHISLKCA